MNGGLFLTKQTARIRELSVFHSYEVDHLLKQSHLDAYPNYTAMSYRKVCVKLGYLLE